MLKHIILSSLVLAATACQQGGSNSNVMDRGGDVVGNSPHAPAVESAPFVGEVDGRTYKVFITLNHRQALLNIGRNTGRRAVLLKLVSPERCVGCLGVFGEGTSTEDSATLIRLVDQQGARRATAERIAPELLADDTQEPAAPARLALCKEDQNGPGYEVEVTQDAAGLHARVQNRIGAALPALTFDDVTRGHLGVVSSILYTAGDDFSLSLFPAGVAEGQPVPGKLELKLENGETLTRNLGCSLAQ